MKPNFLIAKFGKREHLEQLLNGEIFFIIYNITEMTVQIFEGILWRGVFR